MCVCVWRCMCARMCMCGCVCDVCVCMRVRVQPNSCFRSDWSALPKMSLTQSFTAANVSAWIVGH